MIKIYINENEEADYIKYVAINDLGEMAVGETLQELFKDEFSISTLGDTSRWVFRVFYTGKCFKEMKQQLTETFPEEFI